MVLQCHTNIQMKLKLPLIVFSSCCLLYVVLLMPKPRITKQTRSVSEREELVSGVVSKACRLELGQCVNQINRMNKSQAFYSIVWLLLLSLVVDIVVIVVTLSRVSHEPVQRASPVGLTPRHDTRFSCPTGGW